MSLIHLTTEIFRNMKIYTYKEWTSVTADRKYDWYSVMYACQSDNLEMTTDNICTISRRPQETKLTQTCRNTSMMIHS